MEITEEEYEKAVSWVNENGPDEGLCQFCSIGCDSPGVHGGPNGPIFPPCTDWDDDDLDIYIDYESLVEFLRE